MKKSKIHIPVFDLFADTDVFGKGLSRATDLNGNSKFKICLSIEHDLYAHQTLELWSFFHRFKTDKVSDEHYQCVRGEITREELFDNYSETAQKAHQQSWNVTLSEISPDEMDERIERSLNGAGTWVLVGGLPCQAYLIVGGFRKVKAIQKYPRLYLYPEFLNSFVFQFKKLHADIDTKTKERIRERALEWLPASRNLKDSLVDLRDLVTCLLTHEWKLA